VITRLAERREPALPDEAHRVLSVNDRGETAPVIEINAQSDRGPSPPHLMTHEL
jgi:hypothetical protein